MRALIDLGIASELGWPMLQVSELASKEKLPSRSRADVHSTKDGWLRGKQTRKIWRLLSHQAHEPNQIWRDHSHDRWPIGAHSVRQPNILRPLLHAPIKSLRPENPDVRRAECHQHDPGSLYPCRHRRDHASEISARQNHAAFSSRSAPLAAVFAEKSEPLRSKRRAAARNHFSGSRGIPTNQHPRNTAVN